MKIRFLAFTSKDRFLIAGQRKTYHLLAVNAHFSREKLTRWWECMGLRNLVYIYECFDLHQQSCQCWGACASTDWSENVTKLQRGGMSLKYQEFMEYTDHSGWFSWSELRLLWFLTLDTFHVYFIFGIDNQTECDQRGTSRINKIVNQLHRWVWFPEAYSPQQLYQ